jgi:hypothetical protein
MTLYYQKTDQEKHYVDSTGNNSKVSANRINVYTPIPRKKTLKPSPAPRAAHTRRPSPGSGLFAATAERTDNCNNNICGINMAFQFQQVTSNFYSLSKVQEASTVTGG